MTSMYLLLQGTPLGNQIQYYAKGYPKSPFRQLETIHLLEYFHFEPDP